jgi:hypothetical protein
MCCQLRGKTEEIVEHRACEKKHIMLQVRAEAEEILEHRACDKIDCVAVYEIRLKK